MSPTVDKEHTIRLFKGLKTSSLRHDGKRDVGRVNSQYFQPHSYSFDFYFILYQARVFSKRQNNSNTVCSHWTASKEISFSDDVVFNAGVLNGGDG